MLIIPFELKPGSERGPLVVVLILEKENLDRLQHADPFDMKLVDCKVDWLIDRPIRHLDLVIAYEADIAPVLEFKKTNDVPGLMNWLERGRKIIPGDVTPPVRL